MVLDRFSLVLKTVRRLRAYQPNGSVGGHFFIFKALFQDPWFTIGSLTNTGNACSPRTVSGVLLLTSMMVPCKTTFSHGWIFLNLFRNPPTLITLFPEKKNWGQDNDWSAIQSCISCKCQQSEETFPRQQSVFLGFCLSFQRLFMIGTVQNIFGHNNI